MERGWCRMRLWAAGGEGIEEALEVVGVEGGGRCGMIAVGVRVGRGEFVEEALEVVGGEEGWGGRRVAVGIAGVGLGPQECFAATCGVVFAVPHDVDLGGVAPDSGCFGSVPRAGQYGVEIFP